MNYYSLIKKIKTTAIEHKLVRETSEGDIYTYLNSGEHQYPCVFLTVSNISTNESNNVQTLNGSLFYVDRTIHTDANKVNIQSIGITVLRQILLKLQEDNPEITIGQQTSTPFEEKFADVCAGVFTSFSIDYKNDISCSDSEYEIQTITLTQNGVYDVAGYDTAIVNVIPLWGTIEGDIEDQIDLIEYIESHTPEGALTDDLLVSTKVGFLDNGQTLLCGTTFENVFRAMLSKELDVEGVNPVNSIQNEGAAAGNKEVGVAFNVNLSVNYTDGYFKAINSWGQNQPAGCASGDTVYYRNSTALEGNTDTYTFIGDTNNDKVVYKAVTEYGASTIVPKTNYGNDSEVRIASGNTTSVTSEFKGCYRYYYVVNTSTKLTSESSWNDCVGVCNNTGLISGDIEVLGSTATAIGDATHTKYVYVLIPTSKATPTFQNELNIGSTMIVIKNNYTYNNITYKLCALNPDGNAGDKYKNCKIIK